MKTNLSNEAWSPVATVHCNYRPQGRREDGKYVLHDVIPHLCHIELTYACNEKCIFCYNPERAKLGDLWECNYGYVVSANGSSCVYQGITYSNTPTYPGTQNTCLLNSHTSTTDSTMCQYNVGYQPNSTNDGCVLAPVKSPKISTPTENEVITLSVKKEIKTPDVNVEHKATTTPIAMGIEKLWYKKIFDWLSK